RPMKPSFPTPEKPAAPRLEPVARVETARPRSFRHRLTVRFYTTMKPHRIFPLSVQVAPGESPGSRTGGGGGTIPAVIADALVAPPTQIFDFSKPDAPAVFAVTPVAKGRLKGARVEIQQGKSIQPIQLRMRTRTQRLTRILALLTVLLPCLIVYFTQINFLQ